MSSSKREAAKAQRESRNPLLLRQQCYLRVSVANLVVASERSLAESRDLPTNHLTRSAFF